MFDTVLGMIKDAHGVVNCGGSAGLERVSSVDGFHLVHPSEAEAEPTTTAPLPHDGMTVGQREAASIQKALASRPNAPWQPGTMSLELPKHRSFKWLFQCLGYSSVIPRTRVD